MTDVYIALGYDCRVSRVTEGVAEVRDLVNEALDDETLVDLHRASDGALFAVDPVAVRLIEPSPADGPRLTSVVHDEIDTWMPGGWPAR